MNTLRECLTNYVVSYLTVLKRYSVYKIYLLFTYGEEFIIYTFFTHGPIHNNVCLITLSMYTQAWYPYLIVRSPVIGGLIIYFHKYGKAGKKTDNKL
jgi:hypothetical protein